MEDLISYSFQVARGMEFLSSRKVSLAPYCCPSLPGLDTGTLTWTHTHVCYKSTFSVFAYTCVLKERAHITMNAFLYPHMSEEL